VLHHERVSQATASGDAVVAGISTLVGSQAFASALSPSKGGTSPAPTSSSSAGGAPHYPLTLTAKDRQDCPPEAIACVDLSEHITWLQTNGKVSYGPVPMEPGPPGTVHATPTGTFHVAWKAGPTYVSNIYNEPIPWAVFFAPGGIAFHEGSLTKGSHGCVHLTMAAAHYYNENLAIGAEVVVF
jgi:hypothetical protein